MTQVINFTKSKDAIDVDSIRQSGCKLKAGLIAPATEKITQELVGEHTSEPIKSMDDIIRMSQYLISKKKYRDNMLFIMAINSGLRASDLLSLRFSYLINDNFTFRDRFPIFEKKTQETRKRKFNRYITINTAVIEAVTLYLENKPGVQLSDYMFRSESNNGKNNNKPLTRSSVDDMLKKTAKTLGLRNKMSAHSLRKTFGYHQMVMSGNDPRKLLLLQKIFGHSSVMETLTYIGITAEEIDEAYLGLNLGSTSCNYLANTDVVEFVNTASEEMLMV